MSASRAGGRRGSRTLISFCICIGLAAPAAATTLTAPSLSAPGSISYDVLGTPTIQAANVYDMAFLQGYAQAQARFFEMDFDRRAAAGTLSELVGTAALENDVQIRTLGLGRAAWATWQVLDADTKGWLKSFADGVNYWLQTSQLPPEYGALLLTHAEPWSPVDSITVGKGLAFQLSFDLDIDNTIDYSAYSQAAAAAQIDVDALFFGDTHRFAPPDDHITVPGFQPTDGSSPATVIKALGGVKVDARAVKAAQNYRARIANNFFIAPTLHPRLGRGGSNEFAVSGSATASGKPLIANDPHLTLALPPIFMEMHLITSSGLNVTGVSVPGAPGIIQGCNSNLCWGSTVNPLDVTDTFLETFTVNSYGLPTAIVRADGSTEPVQWVFQSFYANAMVPGASDTIVRVNDIGYTNGAVTVIVPRRQAIADSPASRVVPRLPAVCPSPTRAGARRSNSRRSRRSTRHRTWATSRTHSRISTSARRTSPMPTRPATSPTSPLRRIRSATTCRTSAATSTRRRSSCAMDRARRTTTGSTCRTRSRTRPPRTK